MHSQVLKI